MTTMVAAAWTANFSSWHAFTNWLNNSNFAGLVLGIAIPGVFTYAYVAYQHRKTRRHITEHHDRLRAHLDRIDEKLLGPDAPG